MMESRKRNRIERMVSLALGMIILFGGSLSVCAYENPQVIRGAENVFFETLSDEQGTVKFHVGEIQYSEFVDVSVWEYPFISSLPHLLHLSA